MLLVLSGCSAPEEPGIPLYLALQRGDINQIERHLAWGTDVNAPLADGQRALQIAADTGNIVAVRKLLGQGARIDAEDAQGRTPLFAALHAGRVRIADLLLEEGAPLDASRLLLALARQGLSYRDVVAWLAGHGADLEQRDTDGDTPLLVAIRQGNHRLARHLVDNGASATVRTADGTSALALAEQLQRREIAQLLRRQGARLD